MVGVCTDRVSVAIGAILMGCTGAGAAITASLEYPVSGPAWHDEARKERVLRPDSAAVTEGLRRTVVASLDAGYFDRVPLAINPDDAAERAEGSAGEVSGYQAMDLRWDELLIDESPGTRLASNLLLQLGEDAGWLSEPRPEALPSKAVDLADPTGVRLVAY